MAACRIFATTSKTPFAGSSCSKGTSSKVSRVPEGQWDTPALVGSSRREKEREQRESTGANSWQPVHWFRPFLPSL